MGFQSDGIHMSVELIDRTGSLTRTGDQPLQRQFSAATVRFATSAIAVGLAYYHWCYEGWLQTIIFAAAITAALVCALTFLSRRILFQSR